MTSDRVRRNPRPDLAESFPPRLFTEGGPALVASESLATALVAAHLLQDLVMARGTRITPAESRALLESLTRQATESVSAHCRDEARRIRDWLDHPPEDEDSHEVSDLALMHDADVETRRSVARLALQAGLDLELEYYEEKSDTWPRLRATPTRLDDEVSVLHLTNPRGDWAITLSDIRWLMPVSHREISVAPSAKVLAFPPRHHEEE